jgi:AcrR family transcriptional regulator
MAAAVKESVGLSARVTTRDRKKAERRERIQRAAREIFLKSGLEGTTMRAVAKRARVGIGTLFRHAGDKSDLLLMLLNDDMDVITEQALRSIKADGDLLEQLLKLFRSRYEYWENARESSLLALLEVHFLEPSAGSEAKRYRSRRTDLIVSIAEIIAVQQRLGRVRNDVESTKIARFLMITYMSEVRTWLRESELDAKAGLDQLGETFRLALGGLQATAKPAPSKRAKAATKPRAR